MENEIKEMLTWINENLKAVVMNQDLMYCKLKNIEAELKKHGPDIDKEN